LVFDGVAELHGEALGFGVEDAEFILLLVGEGPGVLAGVVLRLDELVNGGDFDGAGQGHGDASRAFGGAARGFAGADVAGVVDDVGSALEVGGVCRRSRRGRRRRVHRE